MLLALALAVALLVVLVFTWPHLRRNALLVRTHWKILLVLGLIGIGVFTTVVRWGLQYTTALNNLMMQTRCRP